MHKKNSLQQLPVGKASLHTTGFDGYRLRQ